MWLTAFEEACSEMEQLVRPDVWVTQSVDSVLIETVAFTLNPIYAGVSHRFQNNNFFREFATAKPARMI